ncbi:MAG: metal-dependent hydrolase [Pyrinomonadaceae bacterium]
MPLPIAHGLVGATIVALGRPQSTLNRDWHVLLLGSVFAISPDFDFFLIRGLHFGRGLHRGFSHSILAAFIVTASMLAVLGISHLRNVLALGAAFLSHGLLDFLTTKRGGGVELLWPFLRERFKSGLIGFSEFPVGFSLKEVIKASLIELVVFVPILLAVLLIRELMFRSLNSKRKAQSSDSVEPTAS